MSKCPDCGGDGWTGLLRGLGFCNTCNGTGEVAASPTYKRYDYIVQRPDCVKHGTLWETDDAAAREHAQRLALLMRGKLIDVRHVWKHLTRETPDG